MHDDTMTPMDSVTGMPTDMLSDEDKAHLDKLTKGKTSDHLRHMANHLHNHADKLSEHARKSITMDDYHKAMKRAKLVRDYDNDND